MNGCVRISNWTLSRCTTKAWSGARLLATTQYITFCSPRCLSVTNETRRFECLVLVIPNADRPFTVGTGNSPRCCAPLWLPPTAREGPRGSRASEVPAVDDHEPNNAQAGKIEGRFGLFVCCAVRYGGAHNTTRPFSKKSTPPGEKAKNSAYPPT
jgi:hypothetical protein